MAEAVSGNKPQTNPSCGGFKADASAMEIRLTHYRKSLYRNLQDFCEGRRDRRGVKYLNAISGEGEGEAGARAGAAEGD
jgi:hypothetical protein